jgi:Phosphoesterase family
VRWYLRFGLSDRDVEELLAERGIEVEHVTVYRWCLFASRPGDLVGLDRFCFGKLKGIGPRAGPYLGVVLSPEQHHLISCGAASDASATKGGWGMPSSRSSTRPIPPRLLRTVSRPLLAVAMLGFVGATGVVRPAAKPLDVPVTHVVVIDMENHSFDNVLGQLCVQQASGQLHRDGLDMGCDGTDQGVVTDHHGQRSIPLSMAKDLVPATGHSPEAQEKAMDGGAMDAFNLIPDCDFARQYRCYTQYYPDQIPDEAELAKRFAISDRMFETGTTATWGSHLELVTGTFDGFLGSNPKGVSSKGHKGWGCDSMLDAMHQEQGGGTSMQPSCIPDYNLDPNQYPYGGAYRATTVAPVPSLMDEATNAGVTWRIYVNPKGSYKRAICPYFGSCLYTDQRKNVVSDGRIFDDPKLVTFHRWRF